MPFGSAHTYMAYIRKYSPRHSPGGQISLGDGLYTLGWSKTFSWQMFCRALMYLVNKVFVVVYFLKPLH